MVTFFFFLSKQFSKGMVAKGDRGAESIFNPPPKKTYKNSTFPVTTS
jgi:hypothetical protein